MYSALKKEESHVFGIQWYKKINVRENR
jgi:hypothetical protein